jgi:putative ABC transport system permease protein
MIWRNLFRRRVRTVLTVLGISVGLGLIVALVAIADGYVESFGSMATRSGSDLTVVQADVADMAFSALDDDVGNKIAGIPGVAQVAGTLFSAVPMPGTPYFLVFGYDPGSTPSVSARGPRNRSDSLRASKCDRPTHN